MTTFVALLRGVNVGRAKRVSMEDLRKLLCKLGYTGVATLLNSGNAVFRAAERSSGTHAAAIAAAILEDLKVEVPVIVRSAADWADIVSENSLASAATDPSRLLVAFAQDTQTLSGLAGLRTFVKTPERFAVGAHAAYLLCPSGILKSKAAEALLGKAGKGVTTRNWATVLKLHALASEPKFAKTPEPPYYVVIFTSLRTEVDRGYARMAERMVELAQEQPGFLGVESARTAGGLGITVSYWSSEAAIAAWKAHADHKVAQDTGQRVWYADYHVRVARVEREYGKHPD